MKLFFRRFKRAIGKLIGLVIFGLVIFLVVVYFQPIKNYIVNGKAFYYVYLGDKEYKKQNLHEAIEYYNKALEIYPEHVKAWYNLGNLHVNYEDYPGAIEAYKTALKYDQNYVNARISLGIILAEELIDLDEAIRQYNIAAKTKLKTVDIPLIFDNKEQVINSKAIAYYNMGLAFRDKSLLFTSDSSNYRDNLLRASESYKKSLSIKKNNYDAQFNYALTQHLLGLYTEAMAGYCKAILIAPLNFEAHYNLAVLLRKKRNYKEAAEEFKNAGNLMVYAGDTFKAAYIYDMLNEASQMAVAAEDFKPKTLRDEFDKKIGNETSDMPIDERASTVAELEKAIIKRLKTASVCKAYLDGVY